MTTIDIRRPLPPNTHVSVTVENGIMKQKIYQYTPSGECKFYEKSESTGGSGTGGSGTSGSGTGRSGARSEETRGVSSVNSMKRERYSDVSDLERGLRKMKVPFPSEKKVNQHEIHTDFKRDDPLIFLDEKFQTQLRVSERPEFYFFDLVGYSQA